MNTAIAKRPMAALAEMMTRQRETISEMAPMADLTKLFSLVRYVISTDRDLVRIADTSDGRLSIVQAAAKLAQLGLEPTGKVGGAYLVKYGARVQVLPYWGSYRTAAIESGACKDMYVVPIHANDTYSWEIDHGRQVFKLQSDPFSDRGPRRGWMFVAIMPDGTPAYEPVTMEDIDKRRKIGGAFWKSWPLEAEMKTAFKVGISRRLPLQSHKKLADLISTDDAAEAGEAAYVPDAIAIDVVEPEPSEPRTSVLRRQLEAGSNGAATEPPVVDVETSPEVVTMPEEDLPGAHVTQAVVPVESKVEESSEPPNKGDVDVVCPSCESTDWSRTPTRVSSAGDVVCIAVGHGKNGKRFFRLTEETRVAWEAEINMLPTDLTDALQSAVSKALVPDRGEACWSEDHGRRALKAAGEVRDQADVAKGADDEQGEIPGWAE